jgi:hypothetical protein
MNLKKSFACSPWAIKDNLELWRLIWDLLRLTLEPCMLTLEPFFKLTQML